MAEDTIHYSKKGQRKVSEFIGQELLYDYITSKLDPERSVAVEEFVKKSREAQNDIQKINNGMSYLEHLSDTQVAQSIIDQVKAPSSFFHVLLQKLQFDEWPSGVKMGLEVFVVAVGVISISMVIPWHKLTQFQFDRQKEVILAEVSKSHDSNKEIEQNGQKEDESQKFMDEAPVGTSNTQTATQAIAQTKTQTNVQSNVQLGSKVNTQLNLQKKNESKDSIPKPAVVETKASATSKDDTGKTESVLVAASEKKSEKKQGFLYRGKIQVTNLVATTPKFVEKITELGGRKAGEVSLGWKKDAGTYFHFTIPESKYQSLLDFSKDYGKLILQKEKHERVMPDGIIRIIFTIEEKK